MEYPQVGLIMGSQSDWGTMRECAKILKELSINFETKIISAHRTPDRLFDYGSKAEKKGVKIEYKTLHIGLGTFSPVQVEDLNRHQMDSEYFEVSPKTAMAINDARKKHRKIVAVGTSTIRALETVVVSGFMVSPKRGWTDKFIYPPYEYKMVDSMITNFHMPKSTLMMMVTAFGDIELLKKAYREAKRHNYRFLSYGDAMIIV